MCLLWVGGAQALSRLQEMQIRIMSSQQKLRLRLDFLILSISQLFTALSFHVKSHRPLSNQNINAIDSLEA